jgi:hypothetical protein
MKILKLLFLVPLAFVACDRPDPLEEMSRNMEKAEREHSLEKLRAWEFALPMLSAVKIDASKRSKSGAIIVEATNNGTTAFWGVKFRYAAKDPNREFAYEEREGLAFIEGGVEPGETKVLKCGFKPEEPYATPVKATIEPIALLRSDLSYIADGTMNEEEREEARAYRQ